MPATLLLLLQPFLLVLRLCSVGSAARITYIGCFADCRGDTRAMPHNAGNLKVDSPAACAAECPGWQYFALQDGQDCFCGNDTGYSTQGPSSRCTTPCLGDKSVKCGGGCANSVYWKGEGPPPPQPPEPIPSRVEYIGCFADCKNGTGPRQRAVTYTPGSFPHNASPALCSAKCSAWQYFALQDGQSCYCGNNTSYASQGPSHQCTMLCLGNESVACGGPCANSVYWNAKGPRPAPPAHGPPGPPLPAVGDEADPSTHDIVWTTASSTGARGALPLGNGECAASVWVEPNGDVLIYATKSDSFDELTSRDKLARLRVRFEPPMQTKATFSQHLFLQNASLVVKALDQGVIVEIFVDANASALRLRVTGQQKFTMSASLEVWRTSSARAQGSFCTAPGGGVWNRSGDVLLTASDLQGNEAIAVAHVNPDNVSVAFIHDTLRRQGIQIPAGRPIHNPMHGRTFGAIISSGSDLDIKRVNATTLSSSTAALAHSLTLTMVTTVGGTASLSQWSKAAVAQSHINDATSFDVAATMHSKEVGVPSILCMPHNLLTTVYDTALQWAALWNRSWVWVKTNCSWCHAAAAHPEHPGGKAAGDPTAVLTLQRYLDLANGRQALYPIHGGGQAWGVDGCVDDDEPAAVCRGSDNPCVGGPTNSGVCNPDRLLPFCLQ